MFDNNLLDKVKNIINECRRLELKIATAESCTGGLISTLLTEIPGSSAVYERGFVSYSNESKIELLTVPTFFIEDFGAASREVAIAMAEGTLLMSKADISVSVTGIAGPDGGSETKPVGTVFLAAARKNKPTIHRDMLLNGSRGKIRLNAAECALDLLLERLKG